MPVGSPAIYKYMPRGDTGTRCSGCGSLSLSLRKFTARTTLTTTTRLGHSSTTAVVHGEYDSVGLDPTDLGFLDEIYRARIHCPFCRLIYHATHSESGQGIGHDGLDPEGKRVSCKIEWHLDSRSVNSQSADSGPTTRRLRIFNDDAAFPEFYVVPATHPPMFSESSPGASDSHHLDCNPGPVGRIMDRKAADLNLLRSWLDGCLREHPDCSNHQTTNLVPLTTAIRLIDVLDMCVREVPPGESPTYAALSYVWGRHLSLALRGHNLRALQEPGGLADCKSKIPLTIWNALEVLRRLSIRYIWVDVLCIVQDDYDDKTRQIQVMDRIYQHAILTICNASGTDSNSGIPGVGETSKNIRQSTERYGDLQLITMRPTASLIRASYWDSRAWTFQERLLSTRCAIFTNDGLVWQCPTTTWREDISSPIDRTLWSLDSVGSPLRTLMGNPLRSYSSCVRIFSSRKLTYHSDKLKAFDGIGTVLGRNLDSKLVFGLPSRYFDWALLWEAESPGDKINLEVEGWGNSGNACLPSWSWCGWDRQVNWRLSTVGGLLFNLHEWLTERTWIVWRIAAGQRWELVHDSREAATCPSPTSTYYHSKRWDGYPPSAAGAFGRSELAAGCRHSAKVPVDNIDCLPALETPVEGRLLFKTFTGFFSLSRKSMSGSSFQSALCPGLYRFGITDRSGDWCGTIVLDSSWMNSVGAVFEFAAISDAKEFTLEELDTWTYYIPEERQQAEWYCFYALMLKWSVDGEGNSVAERVGLAKIFQSAFFGRSFKPCAWKRIVMA